MAIGFRIQPSIKEPDDRLPGRHRVHADPVALWTQGVVAAAQDADQGGSQQQQGQSIGAAKGWTGKCKSVIYGVVFNFCIQDLETSRQGKTFVNTVKSRFYWVFLGTRNKKKDF